MDYSYLAKTQGIQIEISTKCNALCPGCIRTDSRNLRFPNPSIPVGKEMPKKMFEQIVTSDWSLENLKQIEFCGTMDEPFMHSEFLDLLDILGKHKPGIDVSIHTNGGARNKNFYRSVAEKMKMFSLDSVVRFSIDGIGDVNEIYRRGVDFEKVSEVASSIFQKKYYLFPKSLNPYYSPAWGKQLKLFEWPTKQHQIELYRLALQGP